MPTLKAAILLPLASVGASAASVKTRTVTAGLVTNPKTPSRTDSTIAGTGSVAVFASSTAVTTTPVKPMVSVAKGWRSAYRPPNVTPSSDPSPNNTRTPGTHSAGTELAPINKAPRYVNVATTTLEDIAAQR
jgi:hypothetical protein